MSQPKNWLVDDALDGRGGETPSDNRYDADRPSMEAGLYVPGQPEALLTDLGRKVQRVATTPVRTWRRLLGLLALPCAFGLTLLGASGTAHAEQRASRSTALGACSVQTLHSSGYRDMLDRFASRQASRATIRGDQRVLRYASSYRDFAERLQTQKASGGTSAPRVSQRYSLRKTPSCG